MGCCGGAWLVVEAKLEDAKETNQKEGEKPEECTCGPPPAEDVVGGGEEREHGAS